MKYFLDTEFNGFGGSLISIALVSEGGRAFYATVPVSNPTPWVSENVLPIIETDQHKPFYANGQRELVEALTRFLNEEADADMTVIADWPDDLAFLYRSLTFGDQMLSLRRFKTELIRFPVLPRDGETRHNALSDAISLMASYKVFHG